jgi:hypothetical protein
LIHRWGQSPSIGRPGEAFTFSSISAHSRLTWLLEIPLIPIALTSRNPVHVGLLHDGGQRLLGHAARLQEAGEIAPVAQLGNAQLDPCRHGSPNPHIDRTLNAAADNGADLVIIDTAGRTNEAASAAARVADLILVPLQPSLIDLMILGATLDIIRLAGSRPTRALLARVRARHENTVEWLTGRGVEVCPAMLGEGVIYQDAFAWGLAVTEAEPGGKAAEEIRAVYLYASTAERKSRLRLA